MEYVIETCCQTPGDNTTGVVGVISTLPIEYINVSPCFILIIVLPVVHPSGPNDRIVTLLYY